MSDDPSSDIQRAQEIIYRALKRVAALNRVRNDPALFMVLVMVGYSRVAAESCSEVRLLEEGGIDKMIAHSTEQLASMMREDFGGRAAAIAKARRH